MNNNINLIVAMCKNNGIGYNNELPWKILSDLKKFKKLTQGKGNNAVIMGKNTYESIKKSLPNRDTDVTLGVSVITGSGIPEIGKSRPLEIFITCA